MLCARARPHWLLKKWFLAALRVRARLHWLLKNSFDECFVSGHDFSRADKVFYFFPESASADGTTRRSATFSSRFERAQL